MAFHGCLCDECEQLYGYVGTVGEGRHKRQVVYGKCKNGWDSIRYIELVLEAQRRIRERGDEMTPDNVSDEMSTIRWEREQEAKERHERAELSRLERKYRRKRKS